MAPPCAVFPAADLPDAIQLDQGKRRKPAPGSAGHKIDLSACELLSMVQYDCQVERPQDRQETVKCWPVQRWFRRCADQKGSFVVETTAWEDKKNAHA
ncbi:uncharacterized protein B0I36DRAFT_362522 [Microdochium trichocladiopsis]|uniref:Mitochondrial export protein Som1 n=1 Tax=Microdochium trichocladiopsis TaxID=1682393 RepID=A0A9P9BTQ4_9PEZI|nr:uncharacterized protein B0I36DRAFT_362522 [Microdochium trichocladiopsis]KAH7030694.1 hypothetical protein B0I36DRAFT_362522 [Microdochium trichocladiopsis]